MKGKPLIRLPWENLGSDEFEELCYHLLIALEFTDVEWFRGPGDRGRDLLATGTGTGLTSFGSSQKCVIECKRFARGHTVSMEDLTRTWQWMEAREQYQRLIIITTSQLRTDTRDWIDCLNHRRGAHYKITYIESHELFQHLIRHQEVRCKFFPNSEMAKMIQNKAYERFITALHRIWTEASHSRAIRLSRDAFRKLQKEVGAIDDPTIGLIFAEQRHSVLYSSRGFSDIKLALSMINVSDCPIDRDTITLYSHRRLLASHWRRFQLDVVGSPHKYARARVFSEPAPNVIRADYRFPSVVKPGQGINVQCIVRIPHRRPLAGRRVWSALIHRFTVNLVLDISLPNGYYPVDAEATHRTGNVRRFTGTEPMASKSLLKYSERCPTVGGEVSIAFTACR